MKALLCFLGMIMLLLQDNTAEAGIHHTLHALSSEIAEVPASRADHARIHRNINFHEDETFIMAQAPAGFGMLLWEADEIQEVQDSNSDLAKTRLIGRTYRAFGFARPPDSSYTCKHFSFTPASVYPGLRHHLSLGILRI